MISTFSKLSTWISGAVIATTLFAAAKPAYSAAIVGSVNFNGNIVATATSFDFLPSGGGDGDFTVQNFGNTGFFASLTGTDGKIKDLDIVTSPVDTGLNLGNFLTFNAASNVSFTLTKLFSGTSGQASCGLPAAPGQACTPFVGSPINFFNTGSTSSIASFFVEGFYTDSTTGERFQGSGQFSANFDTQNYQQVLAILNTPGGAIETPYTGRFTSVPEPEMLPSMIVLGMAIAGTAALRRRVVTAK